MNRPERLPGRSRHRVLIRAGGEHHLVLQVEVGFHNSPVTGWRDAKLEDITQRDGVPVQ